MLTLAKQVDPTESEETSLRRARDRLSPELATLIGELHTWSANALTQRVEVVHKLLKSKFTAEGSSTRLPPMYGYRNPQQSSSSNRSFNKRGRGRNSYRGQNSRGYHNQPSNAHDNQNTGEQEYNEQGNADRGNSNQRNQSHYRGQGNERRQSNYREQSSYRGQSNVRGRGNSSVPCNFCHKYGHFARDCRQARNYQGSANVAYDNSEPQQNQEQEPLNE